MDIQPAEVVGILKLIGAPVRVPTACWLLTDLFEITDHKARNLLQVAISKDLLALDKGGWIRCL